MPSNAAGPHACFSFSLGFVLFLASGRITNALAQGNATASVTIVTPETFEKCNDLQLIPRSGGKIVPASFSVSGAASFMYSTLVPDCISVARNGHFISICTSGSAASVRVIGANGVDEFFIGGVVQLDAVRPESAQSVDGTFPVTIAFN